MTRNVCIKSVDTQFNNLGNLSFLLEHQALMLKLAILVLIGFDIIFTLFCKVIIRQFSTKCFLQDKKVFIGYLYSSTCQSNIPSNLPSHDLDNIEVLIGIP